MNMDEKDKLKMLLDYWVKHNKEHGEEFKEWAEKAKSSGDTAIYEELMLAVEQMENTNTPLTRALDILKETSQSDNYNNLPQICINSIANY